MLIRLPGLLYLGFGYTLGSNLPTLIELNNISRCADYRHVEEGKRSNIVLGEYPCTKINGVVLVDY